MAKKRKKSSSRRRRSVTGVTRRRHSTRRRGRMGALGGDTGEKVLGIAAGSVGVMLIEEMIIKKKPTLNPMIMGGGELIVGALLSGKPGLEGYVGDGMIAAGAMALFQAIRKKRGASMQGPEYVVSGPDYITGNEDMYITEEGYVVTGAGDYITGPDGEYITEYDVAGVMGDINQGGLGGVNQGGLA